MQQEDRTLLELIVATYAAVGQETTDVGLEIIHNELKNYPLDAVAAALNRCAKECRRIALMDIIDRIPRSHPGAEEAWAMVSKAINDEGETIIMTDPMRAAFSVAVGLQNDEVAARLAFKEVYNRTVAEARARGDIFPRWTVSLGHDSHRRDAPLRRAIEQGRIDAETAAPLLGCDVEELKALAPPETMAKLTSSKPQTRLEHARDK